MRSQRLQNRLQEGSQKTGSGQMLRAKNTMQKLPALVDQQLSKPRAPSYGLCCVQQRNALGPSGHSREHLSQYKDIHIAFRDNL